MAKKKRGVNKSQAIRDYLSHNRKAAPREIVAALAQKGIKVSDGLVSNVKYTSARKGPGRKKIVRRRLPGRAAGTANSLSAGDLFETKKLVDKIGGIDNARRALDALEQLT